ncbi:enoyl-CoA hydratase/isomerase family protein [Marinomonas flavescens]|uniref:enoyl-CoA hydratase/isomerase family protein n=1 Tax=Marinomonas flavescens TaxID=2529379 RepID=UPI0010564A9A|nr:enoyl-CoA hydratase/isomerase family protein [Marinomonas flavescens]
MSCVLFNEYPTQDGKKIVEILLNAEDSLNAITLEMVDLIQSKLDQWKEDDAVAAVLLDSVGEKAFCAGGDIVNLYTAMSKGRDARFSTEFFTREYELDYCIHTYPKPIICWGHGIVMGGGMGLMNGCSHRVVTEKTHMAMPEVKIGYYPDVGGSWFLNRLQGRTGLFLGLTGNPINAADALFLGLADRFIAFERRAQMLENLQAERWDSDAYAATNRVLRQLELESQESFNANSPVQKHYRFIQQVTDTDSLAEFVDVLNTVDTDDKWIYKAKKAISHASPLSMHIIKKQLEVTRHMSLKQVFESELSLSVRSCANREFLEGIRALLVDKDGVPKWTYASVQEVDLVFVESFFATS